MTAATPLHDLAPARQADVLAALAAVETASLPVPEASFRALQDPALRASLAQCLDEAGRVLLKVHGGWLSGYDDAIAAHLAAEGLGSLSQDERAVLALVMIHCVAVPRARGQISSESWLEAVPVPRSELEKSQMTNVRIRAALTRLKAAGILRQGPKGTVRPSHQFLRLTPYMSRRLWENLMLVAQPDGVMASVIRRRRDRETTRPPNVHHTKESS